MTACPSFPIRSTTATFSSPRADVATPRQPVRPEVVTYVLGTICHQVEVPEIVVHEADEPNALVDFLDAEPLTGEHG